MLTACWSVKGGSGTTVVAAALVLGLAGVGRPVVAADFAGDLPAVLGAPDPSGPGLLDWLEAGPAVPVDGLSRIAHASQQGVTIIPKGEWSSRAGAGDADAGTRLAHALRTVRAGAPVIADCGKVETAAMRAFIAAADRSFLVLRPCYLALRRALNAPRPTAVVLVTEPDRSLGAGDVEDVLGVPVVAEIGWEPAIARAVDSGLLSGRMPRRLAQALRDVAA
jgi:MinD-like ATPase involved in chromosome partitioning or flagellar assembly